MYAWFAWLSLGSLVESELRGGGEEGDYHNGVGGGGGITG
jgi:hypothetical protein